VAERTGGRWVLVEVERATRTRGPRGVSDIQYQHVARRRARIRQAAGSEFFRSSQKITAAVMVFTFRYSRVLAGLKGEDRLTYGQRVFDVTDVANWELRNRWIHVRATERRP